MVDERKRGQITVRRARLKDLRAISKLGSEAFSGLRPLSTGMKWVSANWRAKPRMGYWVAVQGRRVVGYILWVEKGGFRKSAVLELEQVAVIPAMRGKGIGTQLVRESLLQLTKGLQKRQSSLKLIEVTTGESQHASSFYERVLGAELVATLPDFFRGVEHILLARDALRA